MKNFKSFKLQNNKAQISFELIIVLAVTTLLTSSILIEFSSQANDTFILSNIKAEALSQAMTQNTNSNCYLKSMQYENKKITLDFEGNCNIQASQVADKVEEKYCNIKPNHDNIINCGNTYEIQVI